MTDFAMIDIFGYHVNAYAVAIFTFFLIFSIGLYRAQKSNKLDWTDLLTRDGRKVSTTKLMQLIGGIVATWVIVKLTLTKELNMDMFVTYLMYIAGSDGYAKYIMARYGQAGSDDSHATHNGYQNHDYGNRNHQMTNYGSNQQGYNPRNTGNNFSNYTKNPGGNQEFDYQDDDNDRPSGSAKAM